jgi:hypothetical protein
MVEELVAELGHGGGGGADTERAAVAVGREASGFRDGLGFRAGRESPKGDATDELEDGFAVREGAVPEVRDAALPDVDGLSGGCAVRG